MLFLLKYYWTNESNKGDIIGQFSFSESKIIQTSNMSIIQRINQENESVWIQMGKTNQKLF